MYSLIQTRTNRSDKKKIHQKIAFIMLIKSFAQYHKSVNVVFLIRAEKLCVCTKV